MARDEVVRGLGPRREAGCVAVKPAREPRQHARFFPLAKHLEHRFRATVYPAVRLDELHLALELRAGDFRETRRRFL